MRPAHARWIVHTGIRVRGVLPQLLGALSGKFRHVLLAAEVEATGGTGLDAGGLEADAYPVRAERALVDLLGRRVELGNIERATGYTILAADAVLLLEIDDAVGVLNDGTVRGAGAQA